MERLAYWFENGGPRRVGLFLRYLGRHRDVQLASLLTALEAGSYDVAPTDLANKTLIIEDLEPITSVVTFNDSKVKFK